MSGYVGFNAVLEVRSAERARRISEGRFLGFPARGFQWRAQKRKTSAISKSFLPSLCSMSLFHFLGLCLCVCVCSYLFVLMYACMHELVCTYVIMYV